MGELRIWPWVVVQPGMLPWGPMAPAMTGTKFWAPFVFMRMHGTKLGLGAVGDVLHHW